MKRFKKIAWIRSHHLHVQWKFKLVGKFTWDNKAKHCWALSTNFWKQKFVQQCFAFTPEEKFLANNLNFHWSWRWWNRIQATFKNLFYFNTRVVNLEGSFKDELCVGTIGPFIFWSCIKIHWHLWFHKIFFFHFCYFKTSQNQLTYWPNFICFSPLQLQ